MIQYNTKDVHDQLEPGFAAVLNPDSAYGVNNADLHLDLSKLTPEQLERAKADALKYVQNFVRLVKKTMKYIVITHVENKNTGTINLPDAYNAVAYVTSNKMHKKHHGTYIKTLQGDSTIPPTQRKIMTAFVKRFLDYSAHVGIPSGIADDLRRIREAGQV